MPRRIQTKKTIARKAKISTLGRKDMRFSVSLVILIGMLTFSLLLLLFSLNKSVAVSANKQMYAAMSSAKNIPVLKRTNSQILDDSSLDFKVTVPAQIGQWFYKTGEVKSLTDKSLSNRYFQVYVPAPGVKSNNFDDQYKSILTIRRFTGDEWSAIGDKCPSTKENKDICDAAGELISKTADSNGDEWVYAFTKPADCPKSFQAKCALADKITESFQLK